MTGKGRFHVVKFTIYILLVITAALFLFWQRNKLKVLGEASFDHLIILAFVAILPVFFNAFAFKVNTSIFNIHLKLREWIGLSVTNTFYNYIFPARSGMAFRIAYLKKQYQFPVSSYLTFLSGAYLILFFVSSLSATVLCIGFFFQSEQFHSGFLYVSLGLLLSTGVFLGMLNLLNPKLLSDQNRISLFLKNSIESFHYFKLNKNKLKYLFLCKFFFLLSISLRLFVSYSVLGIHLSYMKLLLACSFLMFSMVISIIPGNLGIREGIIGIITNIMGLSIEDAMLGALLDRVVSMIIVFVLGIIFHYVLFVRNREAS